MVYGDRKCVVSVYCTSFEDVKLRNGPTETLSPLQTEKISKIEVIDEKLKGELERLEREKMARRRQGVTASDEIKPLVARIEIIGACIAISTIQVLFLHRENTTFLLANTLLDSLTLHASKYSRHRRKTRKEQSH